MESTTSRGAARVLWNVRELDSRSRVGNRQFPEERKVEEDGTL